ncbi:kinase domain-containing protein [Aspergillus aculeatinus CBS 121060]|uniref:Kinase domain-containing protein n=1 Tax=Aspergillus aculeatinus CBS 121060 TaxID=1448322 RepID=A0ACD1GS74_9EURO|nr:kinase domain-containing protein [Aspergillus aculeatinus CBS 121060]RAH63972.1 kinase domain-containing protein [Aspergillus aculeatinus CBS 121060]
MANAPMEDLYHPEVDVEYLEEYVPGGYHPTLIGDTFGSGRYTVVHKLGFGGYSTIWLARDRQRQRYVSLKILTARASSDSREGEVLEHLMESDLTHVGKQFIPRLLDQFSFHGPNGHHRCLVGEPAGGSIAKSKEDSTDLMFPLDAARSTAAQLLLGLSYLHATGLEDPEIIISDYGTSFLVSRTPSPTLHTPALYSPPEEFFNEPILRPTAADIWTLGVNLYEVLGERPLFETFAWDRDDIVAEMVNTLGPPPLRWWNAWAKRSEFFEEDGTPVFRRLRQRLWDMGRGETGQTCTWDVAGGELRALEDLLRAMMAFEPTERPTADQLLRSEYMVQWALPAWERQKSRRKSAQPTDV